MVTLFTEARLAPVVGRKVLPRSRWTLVRCQMPESASAEWGQTGTHGTAAKKCFGYRTYFRPAWNEAVCSLISNKLILRFLSNSSWNYLFLELRNQIFPAKVFHQGQSEAFSACFETLSMQGKLSLNPFSIDLAHPIFTDFGRGRSEAWSQSS